jgi:hypothetical protein
VRSLSVELKLVAAVVVACVAAAVLGAQLAHHTFEENIEAAALGTLQRAADALAMQERSEVEKLASTLEVLLANEELRSAFVARDRDRLFSLAAPVFAALRQQDRITHWYFIEPDPARTVFLRVHRPDLHGDRVERATLVRAIETRDLAAGKELGQTAFALRVVRPWFHAGKLLGYVELAEEIDHFLGAMKSRTGDDYGLLVGKKYLDEQAWARVLGPRSNTWNDRADVVVVDTTTFSEGIIDFEGDLEAIPERGAMLGKVVRGDRAYVRGIFPVRDAGDRKLGALFVLHEFSAQHGAIRAGSLQTFLLFLGVEIAVAAALLVMIRRLVFARLERLRRDLEAHAEAQGLPPSRYVELESDDEIAGLERLMTRVLFPARAMPDPDGAAPQSAAGKR